MSTGMITIESSDNETIPNRGFVVDELPGDPGMGTAAMGVSHNCLLLSDVRE